MNALLLGGLIGIGLCHAQVTLLPWWWALAILLPGVLIWRVRWPRLGLLLCSLALGFAWAGWRAELRLADALDAALEGQDLVVAGYVADLPRNDANSQRFVFVADELPAGVPKRLSLAWYAERDFRPALRAGERWQLQVRLRRPHGSLNPHGFDYEAWLFERGVRAVGYVRRSAENRRLVAVDEHGMAHLQALRETLRDRFHRALPEAPWRGVLIALALGDQGSIPQPQWQLFAQTGITHLVSISGLHVTMLAALAGALCSFLWRRSSRLCLRLPAQQAALLAGALAATGYVAVAGFGVPAQRTLYMLWTVALALWCGYGTQMGRTLGLAMLVVVLLDPWALRAPGFWLSFGAVAALLLVAAGLRTRQFLFGFLRTQWAVTLLSLPLLLAIFQQFSLVSPLANLIAIPVVSFLITPLSLLFASLDWPALAQFAHLLLVWLMCLMEWLAALPHATWTQAAPPFWLVGLALLAVFYALLPRGMPGRFAALLVLVPLLVWTPSRPAEGEWQATVLDVGQGLAVHVQTARHDYLFDTGAQYTEEVDSGERLILPYLRAEGVRRLDGLIVSHDDKDHAGGADSVLAGLPVAWLAASLPPEHALWTQAQRAMPCRRGESWQVDGVSFAFLHPDDAPQRVDNDRSCVLRISSPHGSLLLPGDIEARAEKSLLAAGMPLTADVLVAPHHGSRTSSSEDFVAAVGAREVVFAMGYRNRFGHPHPKVVERYAASGAQLRRSDEDGALRYRFAADGLQVNAERRARARYWHGR